MAVRENQGLQIAVMIFFLLVVLLAVTTYVFFKQTDDLTGQNVELAKQVAANRKSYDEAFEEVTQLKKLMGYNAESKLGAGETPEPDTILADFTKDMGAYGANVDPKNYRTVLKDVFDAKRQSDGAETEAKSKEEDLKQQFTSIESAKETQITTFKKQAADTAANLTAVDEKHKGDVEELSKTKDALAKQIELKRTELDEKVASTKKETEDLGQRLEKITRLYQNVVERNKEQEGSGGSFESPDGRITWVNQREGVVWINIGQDDNLKRQTIFSIYPEEVNDMNESNQKGSIEITRIIDRHMAEARILHDNVADPLLIGDKLHSPVWERGRVEGFALAGFMDIDGDEKSDRAKIRELIKLNGGSVDAEVTDDGKLEGKLELGTRYIVTGDPPTEKSKNQELLDNFSVLTGQAQELGVEKISVHRFVAQMGWRPDERTVQLGAKASANDFKAKPEGGVAPQSKPKTNDGKFKPREAPRKSTF